MGSRLSKRVVDAAEPGATVWDGELPGFGLRVSAKGTRTYVLKYRVHGRQRWYTIGQHGKPMPVEALARVGAVWTPQSARDEALRLLGRVREGADPAHDRREARTAETLKEFAVRYKAGHVELHNKPGTAHETGKKLDNHVLPSLGHIRLVDITRDEVARFHRSLKSTPYQANRCLALVSHMLCTAEKWGVCPGGSQICRGIDRFKETPRERFLSAKELKALGAALTDAEDSGVNANGLAIIRLLMFTGARRMEIEALRWSEVDFNRNVLRLGESKTGSKQIALAPAAREILIQCPRIEGSLYVFPALSGGRHYQGLDKIWILIRKKAGLSDVRLHDLRHTFASFGAAGGLSLPLIGALLGHSQPQTTQRYAHLADDPIQRAAEQVGNAVSAAMSGGEATVVSIHEQGTRGDA